MAATRKPAIAIPWEDIPVGGEHRVTYCPWRACDNRNLNHPPKIFVCEPTGGGNYKIVRTV